MAAFMIYILLMTFCLNGHCKTVVLDPDIKGYVQCRTAIDELQSFMDAEIREVLDITYIFECREK